MQRTTHVLDCGSTGSRLCALDVDHVVPVGNDRFPAIDEFLSDADTANGNAARLATLIERGVRDGTVRDGTVRDGTVSDGNREPSVFIGITAGMRNAVAAQSPRGRTATLAALTGLLAAVRRELRGKGIVVTYPPGGVMSALDESALEHAAVRYALHECNPALLGQIRKYRHIGHIGVGGASIQVSCVDAGATAPSHPIDATEHRLLPMSFTTRGAERKAREYIRSQGRPRQPPAVYFATESCYWVMCDVCGITDRAAAKGHLDVVLDVGDVRRRIAPSKIHDPRNKVSAALLGVVLDDVVDAGSKIVVMGHDYCGGAVTWALGLLTQPRWRFSDARDGGAPPRRSRRQGGARNGPPHRLRRSCTAPPSRTRWFSTASLSSAC